LNQLPGHFKATFSFGLATQKTPGGEVKEIEF